MYLAHLLSRIASSPWAIHKPKGDQIVAYLVARAIHGRDVDAPPIDAAKIHPSSERSLRTRAGKVQIIPIMGIMDQRRMPGESTGPGAPTEEIGRLVDEAAADSDTKAILLHIDSPGGSTFGAGELAAKIQAARKQKPVIAQANSVAASAAYWVASQATEVVVTPGGLVGSIGVYSMHEDISAALEAEGVKIQFIAAGDNKVEGNPFEPLGDDARSHVQSLVDAAYRQFVSAVAGGRDVPVSTVEETYGQGRVFDADRALAIGMVDRVATFDETLARFAPQQTTQRRARAAAARQRI